MKSVTQYAEKIRQRKSGLLNPVMLAALMLNMGAMANANSAESEIDVAAIVSNLPNGGCWSDVSESGYYENCNFCRCSESGLPLCTLRGCIGQSPQAMTCKGKIIWTNLNDGVVYQCTDGRGEVVK